MKLRPSRFGCTRFGYAYEQLKRYGSKRHLDVGCFEAELITKLREVLPAEFSGVDVNRDAVARAISRDPGLQLRHIENIGKLPFDAGSFDSVSLLDVFEHLDRRQQDAGLVEINRVLRTAGILIVSVPGQHFFSVLDTGNLKFRFPKLHRLFYVWRHGEAAYQYRYVSNPYGLVGDVSCTKLWHEHFSRDQLVERVVAAGFAVLDLDGSGFFPRLRTIFNLLLPFKPYRAFDDWLGILDARYFSSTALFLTCQKVELRPALAPTRRTAAKETDVAGGVWRAADSHPGSVCSAKSQGSERSRCPPSCQV